MGPRRPKIGPRDPKRDSRLARMIVFTQIIDLTQISEKRLGNHRCWLPSHPKRPPDRPKMPQDRRKTLQERQKTPPRSLRDRPGTTQRSAVCIHARCLQNTFISIHRFKVLPVNPPALASGRPRTPSPTQTPSLCISSSGPAPRRLLLESASRHSAALCQRRFRDPSLPQTHLLKALPVIRQPLRSRVPKACGDVLAVRCYLYSPLQPFSYPVLCFYNLMPS
jgi:hypothetical protein